MASSTQLADDFYSQLPSLSSAQQSLLLAALSSNNRPRPNLKSQSPQSLKEAAQITPPSTGIDPSMFSSSLGASSDQQNSLDAASYADLGNDFDFDFSRLGGDLNDEFGDLGNGLEDGETGEKRKNSDASEEEELGNKRREGDDKTSKKPGRKPLTSEPTTKRKAQNRAAQRAFRERKEKHLKDLEDKVKDLEKHSESANHENGVLRAQVDRLQTELQEYRKRMSTQAGGLSASPPVKDFSSYMAQKDGGKIDFNFDFPKFGALPPTTQFTAPPSSMSKALANQRSSSSGQSSGTASLNHDNSDGTSPRTSISSGHDSNGQTRRGTASPPKSTPVGGMFSPEFLSLLENSDGGFDLDTAYQTLSPTMLTTDNNFTMIDKSTAVTQHGKQKTQSVTDSTTSNSASTPESIPFNQPTSSCGTSPEPFNAYNATNGNLALQSLDFSSPSQNLASTKTPAIDYNSVDWLASQNGGQFDPVLFGDYRDSQDAIVGGGDFTGGFFEDSFANFNSPVSFAEPQQPRSKPTQQETACSKLMDKVNACAAGMTRDPDDLIVPGEEQKKGTTAEEEATQYLTAHKIWNTLQTCPKFQTGELDIDGLCNQLSAKAKCSEHGHGLILPKDEVEKALWRLAGVDSAEAAAAAGCVGWD